MSHRLHARILKIETTIDATAMGPDAIRLAMKRYEEVGELPQHEGLRQYVLDITELLRQMDERTFGTPNPEFTIG